MPQPALRGARTAPIEYLPRDPQGWRWIDAAQDRIEPGQSAFIERAFDASGGCVCGDQLAQLLRPHADQPISMLARWIVAREVINFEWHSRTLLPLFQFDPFTMTPRPCVTGIVRELTSVFDDWNLALWFVQPNAWLDGEAPLRALDLRPRAVFDAARADRFVARG